jgi:NADH:ubiquinone oxidoreductase subunit
VLFKGKREASKIPAEWHAWLHYTVDAPLSGRYAWQLEHTPNLTGTRGAYVPSGDDRAEGVRAKGTGDYEAWSPAE